MVPPAGGRNHLQQKKGRGFMGRSTLRTCTGMAIAAVVLLTGGCYHAVVDSGKAQSGTIVEDKWADAFLDGLVPPNPVETVQRCPNGIARVETRQSFLNLLATGLTAGIYSPMHIRVYCAAPGSDDGAADPARTVHADPAAGEAGVRAAVDRAALLSQRDGLPSFVVLPSVR